MRKLLTLGRKNSGLRAGLRAGLGRAEIIGKWQKAILDALECHFAPLPPSAAEDIKKVSAPEELKDLMISLWKVKTLQEALDEIKRHAV